MTEPYFRDQLSIDTPEQVDLHLPLAGVGSRFLATLLDLLLQGAVYAVLALLVSLLFFRRLSTLGSSWSPIEANWAAAGFVAFNFMLFWGYYVLFEAFWHGQTPGKRAVKLRVIKDSGRHITLFESMARNLLRVIDALPGFYAVGVLSILISRQNKRLGDLLAGTIVVHGADTGPARIADNLSRTLTAATFAAGRPAYSAAQRVIFPADAIERLSAQDLLLLESFLARAIDLDITTTNRIASELLTRVCSKMGEPYPSEGSTYNTLEAIAIALRSSMALRSAR